ncbi:AAA family ATPase, partial [Candidatus Bathyarchaeota archaeon]|nr:AAA family ATPase [Candidatus Bathyarchaeota archaeon]
AIKRFADDKESRAQFDMLLAWIKSRFEGEIAASEKCYSGDLKAISYEKLWALYPPGTIVYMELHNEDRAFRVRRTWYDDDDDDEQPGLNLAMQYVDYDGEDLGTRNLNGFIRKYAGNMQLSELSPIPLSLADNAEKLRAKLLSRGRKFEAYVGQHYLQYDGIAFMQTAQGFARFSVNGRVMIDCKTHHRLEASGSFSVSDFKDKPDNDDEKRVLTDEEALLANPRVRGYSFSVKKFLEFCVEVLAPIKWNSDCFDSLVLDSSVKKTMQALVSVHSKERESFDDIVEGKGKGLVCVLHGPPGVGKTLTAECVAEYVKRPLYMVSSGDCEFPSFPVPFRPRVILTEHPSGNL